MFESPSKSLNISLGDFDDCLSFVENSLKLRPRLNKMIDWGTLDPESTRLVQSYMDSNFARPIVMYCALFVAVHATFEQYIRTLIEEAIKKINSFYNAYDDLDEIISKNNIKFTGSILKTIHEPLDYHSYDFHDICKAIGTCYPGSKDVRLNYSAFSHSSGTMTPENIEKLFGRINININWDIFGKNSALHKIFEQKKNTRYRKMY